MKTRVCEADKQCAAENDSGNRLTLCMLPLFWLIKLVNYFWKDYHRLKIKQEAYVTETYDNNESFIWILIEYLGFNKLHLCYIS